MGFNMHLIRSHLPCNRYQRSAVEVGISHASHQVCGTWSQRGEAHPAFPVKRPYTSHERRTLLVTRGDELNRRLF